MTRGRSLQCLQEADRRFSASQLVYEGMTSKCYPSFLQTSSYLLHLTTGTMKRPCFFTSSISLCHTCSKKEGLPNIQSSLVIFDEFKGQTTNNVLSSLDENNILCIMVRPNCMDQLQPLDVSVCERFSKSKIL